MGGDDHAAPTDPAHDDGQPESLPRSWAKALFLLSPWGLRHQIERHIARMEVMESRLDKAARKGVIHPNAAARKKSRLRRRMRTLEGSPE